MLALTNLWGSRNLLCVSYGVSRSLLTRVMRVMMLWLVSVFIMRGSILLGAGELVRL